MLCVQTNFRPHVTRVSTYMQSDVDATCLGSPCLSVPFSTSLMNVIQIACSVVMLLQQLTLSYGIQKERAYAITFALGF